MTEKSVEGGFSVVELLVAIAIASLVTMAAGGLLALGAETRDRITENTRISSALLELGSLASLARVDVSMAVESAGDEGFAMDGKDGQWRMGLTSRDGTSLELEQGERQNSVELSAFDDVWLEYLIGSGSGGIWVGADAASSQEPVAVRLRLQKGVRVWRPVVWAASEWPAASR